MGEITYKTKIKTSMSNKQLQELGKKVHNSLSNHNRIMILYLCSYKPHNILSISKKLRIGYKSAYEHIKILEEANLIKTEEIVDSHGKNIFVTTSMSNEAKSIANLIFKHLSKLPIEELKKMIEMNKRYSTNKDRFEKIEKEFDKLEKERLG